MAVFTEPQKWAQTLGKDADVTTIPNTAGETDPSIDKIFPSVFSIPLANGGRAIPRSVLNGLFKLLGDWCFYQQNGGVASYSSTFDYAVGSFAKYNNQLYICIQANGASSTVKAPTDSAYWLPLMYPNDTNNILMAHNAMPTNSNYVNLTVGVSGTRYTAPADGYFCAIASSCTSIVLTYYGGDVFRVGKTRPSGDDYIIIPAPKGVEVKLNYTGTINALYFFYTFGSVSEA